MVVSFKEFLEVPNLDKSGGKTRRAMPQIDPTDYVDFSKWGTEQNLFEKPKAFTVDTNTLKPTQKEFNPENVKGKVESGAYKDKRILVSSDDYIMDGHHAWLAAHSEGKKIQILRFSVDKDTLLKAMKDYPKSYTKKLNERTLYA